MFSRICKRITYANVAMTLALVFAMTGGAYAAKKYLITSTKQIKPSVLAQLKGKAGPTGSEGKAGTPGAPGKEGFPGKEGTKGEPGTNGKDGVSVASSTEPKGTNCKEGGSKFVAANGTTYACNGKEGSPWTAGGTLPSKQTETGAYTFSEPEGTGVEAQLYATISFPIPLLRKTAPPEGTEDLLDENHALYVSGQEELAKAKPLTEDCPGSYVEPKAEPGFLCVYEGYAKGVVGANGLSPRNAKVEIKAPGFHGVGLGEKGASAVGAVAQFESTGTEKHFGSGTWAVTTE